MGYYEKITTSIKNFKEDLIMLELGYLVGIIALGAVLTTFGVLTKWTSEEDEDEVITIHKF